MDASLPHDDDMPPAVGGAAPPPDAAPTVDIARLRRKLLWRTLPGVCGREWWCVWMEA